MKSLNVNSQTFWDVSVAYRMPVNKNNIHASGHGLSLDFYFFPLKYDTERKFNFAILGGWMLQDKLWNNRFNKDFAKAYKDHLIRSNFSGIDSLGVARLANEIETYHGWDVPLASYHYGIHEKGYYGGFQIFAGNNARYSLKLYAGYKIAHAGMDYDSTCISPGSTNSLTTEYGMMYFKRPLFFGGEISLKPFKKEFWKFRKASENIFISFFYEYSDFSKSKFKYWSGCEGTDYIPISEILPSDILNRYKKDVRFGLRLGVFLVGR